MQNLRIALAILISNIVIIEVFIVIIEVNSAKNRLRKK